MLHEVFWNKHINKTAVFFFILLSFGGLTVKADDANSVTCKAQVLETNAEREKMAKVYDVRIEKGVKYLGANSLKLIDFYKPLGMDAKRLPVILYMFGEGWFSGDGTDGGRAVNRSRERV